jgi:hypothetical protein
VVCPAFSTRPAGSRLVCARVVRVGRVTPGACVGGEDGRTGLCVRGLGGGGRGVRGGAGRGRCRHARHSPGPGRGQGPDGRPGARPGCGGSGRAGRAVPRGTAAAEREGARARAKGEGRAIGRWGRRRRRARPGRWRPNRRAKGWATRLSTIETHRWVGRVRMKKRAHERARGPRERGARGGRARLTL